MGTRKLKPCGTSGGFQRHRSRKETPCDECRTAWKAYMTNWHRENREHTRKVSQEWRNNNLERNREINRRAGAKRDKDQQSRYWKARYKSDSMKYRNYEFKRKFGVDMSFKHAQFEAQGSKCAICESLTTTGLNWAMDHDHETGKLCGVLCAKCNNGLGQFQDSVGVLQKAIDYLNKYQDMDRPIAPIKETPPRPRKGKPSK